MYNAFTTVTNLTDTIECGTKHVNLCIYTENQLKRNYNGIDVSHYQAIDNDFSNFFLKDIYITSLMIDNEIIDKCIEHVYKTNSKLLVCCSKTLYENGYFDSKYNLSPIMMLDKLGLLEKSTIVSGVYLDNDDVDLMVQNNIELVLTPSIDAGYGNGIANVVSYIKRGLKVRLGTGDNRFNKNGDMMLESQILSLLVSGVMCKKDSISQMDIKRALYF